MSLLVSSWLINFYPRPPRGGRPVEVQAVHKAGNISIHALREEGDMIRILLSTRLGISIHALREEGDKVSARVGFLHIDFYPRR